MPYKSPESQLTCQRRWYLKPGNKAKVQAGVRRHRLDMQRFVDKLKSKPCVDCGGSFPPYVMQFDHLPGVQKRGAISRLIGVAGWGKKRILEEIAKCELVCANCHAIRTYQREHSNAIAA